MGDSITPIVYGSAAPMISTLLNVSRRSLCFHPRTMPEQTKGMLTAIAVTVLRLMIAVLRTQVRYETDALPTEPEELSNPSTVLITQIAK